MKKKEKATLHEASPATLAEQVAQSVKKMAKLRVERAGSQTKNVRELKLLRQKLAVMKTILRQKELSHEK